MDLAGTFLDYAQVTADENMTTVSLRSLLSGGADYRRHVSSGLQSDSFTMTTPQGQGCAILTCIDACMHCLSADLLVCNC